MPRPPRIHVGGGFYHVTLRGNHAQPIFFQPADRVTLESIVADTIPRCGARVHAYCWMTNHIHLLVQVGEIPLGRVILRIASRYARTVQARLDTTGHLFERRYHSVLVDADAYLLAVLRYIHQNPVRAGIAASPGEYRWSSHHAYLRPDGPGWVTTEFALRMLGSRSSVVVEQYRRLMQNDTHSDDLRPHEADERVLGSDDFLARVTWPPRSIRPRVSFDELLLEVAERFSVRAEDLSCPSRARRLAAARAWLARCALDQAGASICEVARRLNRSEASIRGLLGRHPPE